MKIKTFEIIPETEARALNACENIIQRGLGTFLEVGEALLKIRDGRLYRASHTTFEDYCRKRWQMGGRHALRLTAAAIVAKNLGPRGPIPTNEAQLRPLTNLPVEKQMEAWAEAVRLNPNPTSRQVRTAVQKIAPESFPTGRLRVLPPEPTREERCCALFEILAPELQYLKEEFNDSPHIHDIIAQCLDGLWLCQEEVRERAPLAG